MQNSGKVHSSAVVIIPPETVWPQIQDIRRDYDKAYERWMPHINLLYPFLSDKGNTFKDVHLKLSQFLADFQPFDIEFSPDSFGHFKFGARSTFWLKPEACTKVTNATEEGSIQKQPQACGEKSQKTVKVKEALLKKKYKVTPGKDTPVLSAPVKAGIVDVTIQTRTRNTDQFPSLDGLKDAVWTLHDNVELAKGPTLVQPGLDSLRFAVWGEYDDDVNYYMELAPTITTGIRYPVSSYYNTVDAYSPNQSDGQVETEETTPNSEGSEDEWTVVPNQNSKYGIEVGHATDPDADLGKECNASDVVALQQKLESCYPECFDLSTKSADGFQPHLTLGQVSSSQVPEKISKLKDSWKTVRFLVDKVHIISRRGALDPFKIKYSVPLGTKISSD